MAESPVPLTDRPDAYADVLADLLSGVRLTGALYYRVAANGPWPAVNVPAGTTLTAAFGPRTRTVLSYHVVVEGSCWTGTPGHDPVLLERGDVVVYPRGDAYFLAGDRRPSGGGAAEQLLPLLQAVSSGAMPPSFTFGDEGDRTAFVCGFLGCDPRPFDPLLAALPAMLHVPHADDRLARLVGLAIEEVEHASAPDPVRDRLSESMFIETVRRFVAGDADNVWLRAANDPVIGATLTLMRDRTAEPWTLPLLADAIGISRSVLSERFTRTVGLPPMRYLARARLQLAARILSDGNSTVASVARDVGYGSEATFNRAFKRELGLSPGEWRAQGR